MFGADWNIGLAFLRVLLSWPPLAAGVAVFILHTYGDEIRSFLGRLKSFNFGPLAGQSERVAIAAEPAPPPPIPDLPVVAALNDADRRRIDEWVNAQGAAARIWEFRYLNLFYAPFTQLVLDWMISLNADTTMMAFEAMFGLNLPGHERLAILNALEFHVLIRLSPGGVITVTDKGREYAGWHERKRPPAVTP